MRSRSSNILAAIGLVSAAAYAAKAIAVATSGHDATMVDVTKNLHWIDNEWPAAELARSLPGHVIQRQATVIRSHQFARQLRDRPRGIAVRERSPRPDEIAA